MKRKVFLKLIAFVLFTSAIVIGVNITLNDHNAFLSDIALGNIEILAQNEGPSNCPEGRGCSMTFVGGGKCSVCCPPGKTPKCDIMGCECN